MGVLIKLKQLKTIRKLPLLAQKIIARLVKPMFSVKDKASWK
jgi:hypothetical protein